MPTASARLRRKLELARPAFATPGRLLLEHPRARELCADFMAASAYVTLATVPLMEAALERARRLAPEDAVSARLADYLEVHIPEELHGGEPGRAALDDLEALEVDTVALVASAPPQPVAALIGSQFFWIHHRHPVAVLGLIALEAFHPHASTVEQLIETTGLPRDGFRQLLLHAELDVAHAEELHHALDAMPLEQQHEELIGLSGLHSMACLIDAWLDVVAVEDAAPVAT